MSMRRSIIIVIGLAIAGCTTARELSIPPERAQAYLNEIAKQKGRECGETYSLILQYKEAAIPVVLKALDLCPSPTNATAPAYRILSGAAWTYRLGGDEMLEVVETLMREATQNTDSAISQRAREWLDWRLV